MNKSWDMMRETISQVATDKMTPRYAFHTPFMVRLPERSDWDRVNVPLGRRGFTWWVGQRQMKALLLGCMVMP
jgi:hypothetical protein